MPNSYFIACDYGTDGEPVCAVVENGDTVVGFTRTWSEAEALIREFEKGDRVPHAIDWEPGHPQTPSQQQATSAFADRQPRQPGKSDQG